jgi:hypothetical protein
MSPFKCGGRTHGYYRRGASTERASRSPRQPTTVLGVGDASELFDRQAKGAYGA